MWIQIAEIYPKMKKNSQNKFRGMLAGLCSALTIRRIKPAKNDLHRTEFTTSTQKIGIRFTEKIRNTFRHKWLKKR
jgi:hypothetical protein